MRCHTYPTNWKYNQALTNYLIRDEYSRRTFPFVLKKILAPFHVHRSRFTPSYFDNPLNCQFVLISLSKLQNNAKTAISSSRRCSVKKVFLEISKKSLAQVFSCKLWEISKNPVLSWKDLGIPSKNSHAIYFLRYIVLVIHRNSSTVFTMSPF